MIAARRTIRLCTRKLLCETLFAQYLALSSSTFHRWALLDAVYIIFAALALLLRRPVFISVMGVSANLCDSPLLSGLEESVELCVLVGSLHSLTRNSRHVDFIEILDGREV